MEIDYKKSVIAMLGEYGDEFHRTRTLGYDKTLKLLEMLEIALESGNVDWKSIYMRISL